jgi:signal transduction histidine kinase
LWIIDQVTSRFARRLTARSQASLRDYALTAAGVAAAGGLRELFRFWTVNSPNFPIFYPVILIAALIGGLRLGLFAQGLSLAVVWWVWLVGLHHWPFDRPQMVTVIMFILTGGLMVAAAALVPESVRRALAAEERFRLAQEASLDAFAIFEPVRDSAGEVVDFRWSHANSAADALAPRDHRPLVGRRLLTVFPDFAERGGLERYLRLLTDGAPDQIEFWRPIDGVDHWLRSSGVRIGDSVGVTFRDVTELVESRRDLEARVAERTLALEASLEERARAEAALAQAQRLETVGRLTGGVAHDFNNLLTVIIGGLDMIQRNTQKPDRIAHLAAAALAAARRGEQLTRQLLAFSRHREAKLEVVSMAEVIAPLEALFRRVVSETVRLDIEVAPDLGHVRMDSAQFEAALLNLVVNAVDATPDGGAITIAARRSLIADGQVSDLPAGRYVTLSVSDTGMGMPPEVLQHVFEPYYTTKPIGKGTGLGLAQVYGFARQAGGAAVIESAPERGTTVVLYLPVESGAAARPQLPDAPKAAEPFAPGGTVLLVEDDPAVREVALSMLSELGLTVLAAADSGGALDLLRGPQVVALLFSDVAMPGGMSGVDLAWAARALRPDLPILLTTGYAAGRLDGQDGPLDWPVLRKPYRSDELAAAVRAAIESGLISTTATD